MVDRFHVVELDRATLEAERRRVLALLEGVAPFFEVLEVGSTAVEGVIGKGDLDLLVRVSPSRFVEARALLDARLARNAAQFSDDAFQGYRVESPLDVAVQLTVSGGPYDDFERFLELLRADRSLREAYNELKRAWDGRPMDGYREAKRAFIEAALSPRA